MTDDERREMTDDFICMGFHGEQLEYIEGLSMAEFRRFCFEPDSRPWPIRVRDRFNPELGIGTMGAMMPPPSEVSSN